MVWSRVTALATTVLPFGTILEEEDKITRAGKRKHVAILLFLNAHVLSTTKKTDR